MGTGLGADIYEAMFWYEKAAEQNHIVSQYLTGKGYLEGEVVQDDKPVYLAAWHADQNHKLAARYLGDLRTGRNLVGYCCNRLLPYGRCQYH